MLFVVDLWLYLCVGWLVMLLYWLGCLFDWLFVVLCVFLWIGGWV